MLNMEGMFEDESQLRRCVEHELLSEQISPDQALKVDKFHDHFTMQVLHDIH